MPEPLTWHKSSYSNGGDSNCVEVASGHPTAVPIRDSKMPSGPVVLVSPEAFTVFTRAWA